MRGIRILKVFQGRFVYVCNCNAIRQRQVHQAIAAGAATPKAVFDHVQCRPQCAKCVCEMREMIDDAQMSFRMAAE